MRVGIHRNASMPRGSIDTSQDLPMITQSFFTVCARIFAGFGSFASLSSRFLEGFIRVGGEDERGRITSLKLKAGQAVIFLGCGSRVEVLGVAKMIGREGRLVCIDQRLSVVDRVRRQACRQGIKQIEVIHGGSTLPLPLSPRVADVIYARDIVSCCADPAAVLEEFGRLLRPSGRLILENRAWSNRRTIAMITSVPQLMVIKSSGCRVFCRLRP